jgi:hypothetical protein
MHLSYNDRRRIESGQSDEVAKEKLTTISRSLQRLKIAAVGGIVFLVVGSTLVELSILDIIPGWVAEELISHFSASLVMGGVLVWGLWRALKMERQQLLCELVIAHCDERSVDEHTSEDSEAVPA